MRLMVMAALLLAGCKPSPEPVTPAPPDADAAPEPERFDAARRPTCREACEHLRETLCPEGEPPCERACLNAIGSGLSTLSVSCLASVGSCSEIDRCSR